MAEPASFLSRVVGLALRVEKKVLEALTELLGQFQKGRRLASFTEEGGEAGRGGRLQGLTPTPLPACPQKLRQPNPHTAGSSGFPAKFALTLQDTKHSRVPMGEAVTAVPFNRVYDFPGASQPGDARERARKRKFLGDVNAVKTLASGMRSSCPGKWRGVGSGAVLEPSRERKGTSPQPRTRSIAQGPCASRLCSGAKCLRLHKCPR